MSDDTAREGHGHSEDDEEYDHTHDHHDEHDHGAGRPAYDPENVSLPERAPPLRSTAPQSEFTMRQVALGFVVTLLGVAVVFGLPLALV